jgi:hypothetical protein
MTVSVRAALLERLSQDLIGFDKPDEKIADLPSDRYLTGVLFPRESRAEPEADDGIRAAESDGGEESGGGDETAGMFLAVKPASAGLSFSVETTQPDAPPVIDVEVSCGMYSLPEEGDDSVHPEWSRRPFAATKSIDLRTVTNPVDLGNQIPGLQLYVRRAFTKGVWTVTLAAMNQNRASGAKVEDEKRTFFQFRMTVRCSTGARFAPRPSRKAATDEDGRVASLIYRGAKEYAVGHTCSAEWAQDESSAVQSISTTWVPVATVYAMSAAGDPAFEPLRTNPDLTPLSATWLASAGDDALAAGLDVLTRAYGSWIDSQEARIPGLEKALQPQAKLNVKTCREGLARMQGAVGLLRKDDRVRTAFRLAQKAMVIQRRWSKREPDLVWRPFQLGFQLLSLESLAIPNHPDRRTMDLLWFPTGGGKTEAYLALTAVIFFLRRLQGATPDAGDGVAVLMRYTLRLLTVQQFQRAAAMVLACEYLRRGKERPASTAAAQLGTVPFSIGLWVGGGATPNSFDDGAAVLNGGGNGNATPKQLLSCPCCRGTLVWRARQKEQSIHVSCETDTCELGGTGKGLPVWTVDTDVYRERPSLVIATVDKFAQIARKLDTGALVGLDRPGARAPDLIIQDELHLISGPLGTITALYEVAIDFLCSRGDVRPKIIGSTATIRRASEQIRQLFDRATYQFPPPCIDASNSGFAVEDRSVPGRLYAGVTTVGRSPKFTLQAACATLLQAVAGSSASENDLDPYWTLVTYFNSLRELGGAVVLMLDDVPASVRQYAHRHGEKKRTLEEPVELTSRVSSKEIPDILEQLQVSAVQGGAVDVLLASNMISVGVDIPRLGLMVVNGQPKTMAEYIQATSRVGREFPGLVVALYNHARVRDRSHFETFPNWHTTLYREVEATSVTPFAARARDKALPAVIVAMARHFVSAMAQNVELTPARRAMLEPVMAEILRRVKVTASAEEEGVAAKVRALLDEWAQRGDLEKYWDDSGKKGTLLMSAEQYAAFGAEGIRKRAWPAPNSMREVEPGTPYRLKERLADLRNGAGGGSDAE